MILGTVVTVVVTDHGDDNGDGGGGGEDKRDGTLGRATRDGFVLCKASGRVRGRWSEYLNPTAFTDCHQQNMPEKRCEVWCTDPH